MSEPTGPADGAAGGGEVEERHPESDAGSGVLRVFGRQLKRFRCGRAWSGPTDRGTVRQLEEQYGLLRAQALTPRESLTFVEDLLGET